jgi:hypothetical protein
MKNLEDYLLRLPNHLGNPLVDETMQYLTGEKMFWEEHVFRNNRDGTYSKKGRDCYFSRSVTPNHFEMMQAVWRAIDTYIKEKNTSEYFAGWEGYTQVEYHRYYPTSRMIKHCDHIHDIFDGTIKGVPILSIVGVLNEGYEGGEFVMFDDKVVELNKGDMLVFPSCFLYPHMVKELLSGVRYSFVSWVY